MLDCHRQSFHFQPIAHYQYSDTQRNNTKRGGKEGFIDCVTSTNQFRNSGLSIDSHQKSSFRMFCTLSGSIINTRTFPLSNRIAMTDLYVVVSLYCPKHSSDTYNYNEWKLEEPSKGFTTKRAAIKRAIQVRKDAELFMNWGSDEEEDMERTEWTTCEMMDPNYDDDEEQVIMVMRRSEYEERAR